jgi:hypothetical protein
MPEFTLLPVVAGTLLGIQLLDHLIVTDSGWLSFKERGLCNPFLKEPPHLLPLAVRFLKEFRSR